MIINNNYTFLKAMGLLFLCSWVCCVDPVDIDLPPPQERMIVEGFISTDEPPYSVKVSLGFGLDAINPIGKPVEELSITLFDDSGESELLTETIPGTYQTTGQIKGEIGKSYHIEIETPSGELFESEPDKLEPTGSVNDIRFQYNQGTQKTNYGEIPANVFEIFVDGDAGPNEVSFTRWNVVGTYEIVASPELRTRRISVYRPIPIPPPCSGYVIRGCVGATKVVYDSECTCCSCWVTDIEDKPQLSDNSLVANGQFRDVKVTEIPITAITFHNKYKVEIEQMSMTRNAFEFFRLVRSQKEDSDNFFQPTFGEIAGNIKAINNETAVTGIFWATQIARRSTFLGRDDVPYLVPPMEIIPQDCRDAFPFSSNIKPDGWD